MVAPNVAAPMRNAQRVVSCLWFRSSPQAERSSPTTGAVSVTSTSCVLAPALSVKTWLCPRASSWAVRIFPPENLLARSILNAWLTTAIRESNHVAQLGNWSDGQGEWYEWVTCPLVREFL